MKFEWDEEKERVNIVKHHISFSTAARVFNDPYYVEMYDFEHSVSEDRYIVIGMVKEVLFVIYTERGDITRLISARLANAEERRIYYDQNIYFE